MTDDSMSENDKALFRAQMRGVKPLDEKTLRVKETKTPPPPLRRKTLKEDTSSVNYQLSDYIKETVLTETVLSYCHPDLSRQRFRDLKRGEIRWQARLDLHGMTTEAASRSLSEFIHQQFNNNNRFLLIIHGKGGYHGEPPVIKNQVNRWLPQFNEVLAFHSALPKDGGLGAVYVFLRKNLSL